MTKLQQTAEAAGTDGIYGVVTDDPLADLPIGACIALEPIWFSTSDATDIPQGVTNWTFFEGALLMVFVRTAEEDVVVGTAAVIAPGLAISAAHVLTDYLAQILAGAASLICIGPRSVGLDFWRVRRLSTCDTDDDVAYLSLELASAIPPQWRLRTIALTTRAPRNGETLHVVGFKFPTVRREPGGFRAFGNLYFAAGPVAAVYPIRRDALLLPYPCIEIACGSLNGMSGGAVLDGRGRLVGVISRGWETDDGQGPSYAAWIVGALNRSVEISWPPGMYPQPIHLLAMDTHLMPIEGRDRIEVVSPLRTSYQVWFE